MCCDINLSTEALVRPVGLACLKVQTRQCCEADVTAGTLQVAGSHQPVTARGGRALPVCGSCSRAAVELWRRPPAKSSPNTLINTHS